MSLIATRQTSGPNATATTRNSSRSALTTASLCRRKRRQASSPGEKAALLAGLATASAGADGSTVRDAGVEPAIQDIGDEVEEDHQAREHEGHRHDDRRVVG